MNGYFLGGYCSNNLNSTCTIMCHRGYKLLGSSTRTCSIDVANTNNQVGPTWTGYAASCKAVECDKLNVNENLIHNCSQERYEYGSRCFFTCSSGFRIIGSHVRVCLANGMWSGLETKCQSTQMNND